MKCNYCFDPEPTHLVQIFEDDKNKHVYLCENCYNEEFKDTLEDELEYLIN